MTFKKILKIKKAQSSIEYILLFAIIAGCTIISVTTLLPGLRRALGQDRAGNVVRGSFFEKATQSMR